MKRSLERLWIVLGMAALLFGCGSGRGALDGRIIDHESAPVPGAFVLVKRERGVGLEGGVACDAEENSRPTSSSRRSA
jgi:hypothetical protein